MHFTQKVIIAVACLLSTAQAVRVPKDLPDGLYKFNDAGEFTLVTSRPVTNVHARQTVSNPDPRAVFTPSRHGCYSTGGNAFDVEGAQRQLGDWCNNTNNYIAENEHYAEINIGVVVYVCSRRQDLPCSSDGINTGVNYINQNCGNTFGWADDTGSGLSVGVTYVGSDASICGNPL